MSEVAVSNGARSGIGVAWRAPSAERLAYSASKGDERAFAAIFRRYHQSLYRFCLATVGNPQDAQDALQNTMVKALCALPGEQRSIQLEPWLYRIAHNESVNLLRRRRETRQLDPRLEAARPEPAVAIAERERLQRLIVDIGELPERQRGALVMRELGGLSFAEIATALDASPAAARQTVYEARVSLQRMAAGRELGCATVTRALSDADGRPRRRRDIRAHLRSCESCRRFRGAVEDRRESFAALSPLPVAAAVGLMRDILGGSGAGGSGLAGVLGSGAGASLGTSAIVKSAATLAIVATVGVTAADRGGLVDVVPGSPGAQVVPAQPSSSGDREAMTSSVEGGTARRASVTVRPESAAAPGGNAVGSPPAIEGRDAGTTPQQADPWRGGQDRPQGSAAATGPEATDVSTMPPGTTWEHGRGREQAEGAPPAAAAHGQQTAAAHKAAGHGSGSAGPGPPGQAGKSSHPAHPANPGAEKAQAPAAPPGNPGGGPPQAVGTPQPPGSPGQTGGSPSQPVPLGEPGPPSGKGKKL